MIVAAVVATAIHLLDPIGPGTTVHRGVQAAVGATVVVVAAWITMVGITAHSEPEIRSAVTRGIRRFRS